LRACVLSRPWPAPLLMLQRNAACTTLNTATVHNNNAVWQRVSDAGRFSETRVCSSGAEGR
jgi:hypothetical protein